MAAGDIEVYMFPAGDTAAIIAGLAGVLVADIMTVHEHKGNVFYTVVKAA